MFSDLCLQIKTIIGESEFNSEDYLNGLSSPTISNIGKPKMMYAHMQSTGGFICGETKIALSLRLLAGGSYLDLSLLYEISSSYSYEIFHHVVQHWFNNPKLIPINGKDFFG